MKLIKDKHSDNWMLEMGNQRYIGNLTKMGAFLRGRIKIPQHDLESALSQIIYKEHDILYFDKFSGRFMSSYKSES